jgi:hypothetical protein
MKKEEAKKQFDEMTEKYGIVHTFSFDEAWDWLEYKRNHIPMCNPIEFFPSKLSEKEFETGITKVQSILEKNGHGKELGMKKNPVIHKFTDGQYIREIFNPAGELIVTAIHKVQHPFFLLKGEMSIMTKEGENRIKSPYYGVTEVGTKRIIYAHTDCIFVTVHPNPSGERDIPTLEKQISAEDFEEIHNMNKGCK